MNSGDMFEVSETSMAFPSIHPSVEPACIRDMTLQNIESTKTNELVSPIKILLDIHIKAMKMI